MSKIISTFTAVILTTISVSAVASHSVSGYYRGNGAYVQPHMSMDPYEARSSGYSYHNNELVPYSY